jgi:CRISPR-associated protein Csx17
LDFVRSVASLGVDRGIDRFVRYCFVERHGQNMLAVPVGRVGVRDRVSAQVPVLAQLDGWTSRVRQAKSLPATPAALLRRLEEAQFELALRSSPQGLLRVLVALAELERAVALSSELRKVAALPVAGLDSRHWVPALDDGSVEFRLALALASQRDRVTLPLSDRDRIANRPACFLRSVQLSDTRPSRDGLRRLDWSTSSARVEGLGRRPLDDVLAAFLQLRIIDSADVSPPESMLQVGVQPAFELRRPCPYEDVVAYVTGRVDDRRLGELIAACLMLDYSAAAGAAQPQPHARTSLPLPAHCLLAPFFHGRPLSPALDNGQSGVRLRPDASWVSLLLARQVEEVAQDALRRLRIARFTPLVTSASALARGVDGRRLAASLCFPMSDFGARILLARVALRAPADVVQPQPAKE